MRKILPLHSTLMYLGTFALEVPVILTRVIITYFLLAIALAISGHDITAANSWAQLAVIPSAWSLIALLTPLGSGWWWKQSLGGRGPSELERHAYEQATQLLNDSTSEPLPAPKSWFVLDTPELDAAVCGEALMLSRGLIESDHLPAVLAHELGHLATPDGRLTAAINRLVLFAPRPGRERQPQTQTTTTTTSTEDLRVGLSLLSLKMVGALIRGAFKFAKGGFALRILRPAWGKYWRQREYTADQYAARLGQAEDLAEFLQIHALIHDHPVPFIWLTEQTHPPTALRIEKLKTSSPIHAQPERQSA
jgi:Zn-dependent protease with chaperone function